MACRRNKDPYVNKNINQPVDKRSGQIINQQIQVAQIGRTKVKNDQQFSETTADHLMDKHLKSKRKGGPAMFLVDRIRFQKKRYREYLSYREIDQFHRFQARPTIFMLFVTPEKKRSRRSYESFRCQNPEDVQTIKDLIFATSSDPKRLLQDTGPTRLLSISSSSSSEYYIEKRPSHGGNYAQRPVQMVNASPPLTIYSPSFERVTSPPMGYRRSASQVPIIERRIETGRNPSIRSSSAFRPERLNGTSSIPSNDQVTFLRSDNINGPKILDRGPVYMYVSRSRQNRTSWSSSNPPSPIPSYNNHPTYYN